MKKSKILLILLVIIIVIGVVFFVWKNKETRESVNRATNNVTQNITSNNTENSEANTSKNNTENKTANTSANNTEKNTSTTTVDTKQLLLNVMNNKEKFIDKDNKEVYLKDFKIVENQTAKVDKYTFVDLDKDGVQELVIYTTSDYGAYIILHYEDNKVYGYMIGVRSFENLKTDGSFMGSSGANSIEYLTISFKKNSYTIKEEAIYDKTDKTYKINGANVSEKEIEEYAEKWNKKESVSWIK